MKVVLRCFLLISVGFVAGVVVSAFFPQITRLSWWEQFCPYRQARKAATEKCPPATRETELARSPEALLVEVGECVAQLQQVLDDARQEIREAEIGLNLLRRQRVPETSSAWKEQQDRLRKLQEQEATLRKDLGEAEQLRSDLRVATRTDSGVPEPGIDSGLRTRVRGYLLRRSISPGP
jgi:hypothetical protein